MKFSKYNILISSSKKTDIVYNSLSDKFIFLKKGRWENCITNINTQCYEKLRRGGFIVDDNVDETQMYIENARKIENDVTCTHLIINPTINCNLNCSAFCLAIWKFAIVVLILEAICLLNTLVATEPNVSKTFVPLPIASTQFATPLVKPVNTSIIPLALPLSTAASYTLSQAVCNCFK